jgi:uncharacterized membrane protein
MPLGATLYEWLLFLHVVAAMVWLGALVTLGVLATQALRGGEPDAIARLVRSLRMVGPLVLAPAMVAVLGFGVWLVLDSDAWDFGQTWIWLALALFAAVFLVGAIFQSRAAIGAERAAAAGDESEPARQLRRWAWGMGLIVLFLVVITWDMVAKHVAFGSAVSGCADDRACSVVR